MDVTVCVATYGDQSWMHLASKRAVPSAKALGVPVVRAHRASLHAARNTALAAVKTEWVVFLDADDELEPGYFDAMATGSADLRAPAVRYLWKPRDVARAPQVPRVAGHKHDCTAECLPDGNWLVVGSMVRTDLVREVGGWEPWPVYEDWALWLRCWLAGASIEAIPAAVYRAHARPDSRNRGPDMGFKNRTHRAIVDTILGPDREAA